jgi:hypothetical protein
MLDETDIQILELLIEDARRSYTDIVSLVLSVGLLLNLIDHNSVLVSLFW